MAQDDGLIVSVSGIRGIIGESLTPERACAFASALGTLLRGQAVVVSRDSRPSGVMLRHAVIAGLLAAGCRVEDIGIAPTPTCGLAVRHFSAAGGIQITASHNPAPWNGLKLFGADGAVLSAARGAEVRAMFESGSFRRAAWDAIGNVRVPLDPGEIHTELVRDQISVAKIHNHAFRVLLDANGGAGGPLAGQLLQQLGCEVIEMGCNADGHFAHEAEPIPAHLTDVAPLVPRAGAHVGFVLDPDADRLALIDETGKCLSEELTLALAVKYRLSQDKGPIVVNMSTSRIIEDIAQQAGCHVIRTAVGEANVVERMRDIGALIGGEGNGGVIDPRIGWVRDPFIGMAMILNLMADTGLQLSELVSKLPKYEMLKTKCTIDRAKLAAGYDRLCAHWPEATINRVDGLRLDGKDWWLHVRGSNTEPIVRIIAESPDAERTATLCQQAADCMNG